MSGNSVCRLLPTASTTTVVSKSSATPLLGDAGPALVVPEWVALFPSSAAGSSHSKMFEFAAFTGVKLPAYIPEGVNIIFNKLVTVKQFMTQAFSFSLSLQHVHIEKADCSVVIETTAVPFRPRSSRRVSPLFPAACSTVQLLIVTPVWALLLPVLHHWRVCRAPACTCCEAPSLC